MFVNTFCKKIFNKKTGCFSLFFILFGRFFYTSEVVKNLTKKVHKRVFDTKITHFQGLFEEFYTFCTEFCTGREFFDSFIR